MLQAEQIEDLITVVVGLDREALIAHLVRYRASFPIDFTREFLQKLPTDRLRHIFLALCLQQQRMPEVPAAEVA